MNDYKIWSPDAAPIGLVQILHGMAEHIDRYDRLARVLNAQGYLVCGGNHRGHGPKAETLGYFADKDGWEVILQDAHAISQDIRDKHVGVPFVLLGHSMGSFLAREYALRWGRELDGLVLSGTGCYEKGVCAAGRAMAKLSPRKKPAAAVNNIAFAGNNKPFAPGRTGFEWLSRDEKEVDKYVADPLCGFCFTGSAFADFFGGLAALTDLGRLSAMPSRLPVCFLSGDKDPVGQMGEGVKKVAEQFRQAGMKNVTVKLYPDARHELFNELNRDEVTADLVAWLDGIVR